MNKGFKGIASRDSADNFLDNKDKRSNSSSDEDGSSPVNKLQEAKSEDEQSNC